MTKKTVKTFPQDRHPIPTPLNPEVVNARIANLERWAHNLNLCPPDLQDTLREIHNRLNRLEAWVYSTTQIPGPDNYPPPPGMSKGETPLETPPPGLPSKDFTVTDTKALETLKYVPQQPTLFPDP